MQNSLFLVFVSALICQVYGQRLPPSPPPSREACACTVVDDCVQKETAKKITCQKDCSASLNDKAQVCVKSKHDALSKAFTDGNACIEKALGRPCITATRARRSPAVPAYPAVFHGGMGPAKITILTGATPKTEFAAFNKCFFECIHKDDPKPAIPQGPGNNQRREWATTKSGQGGHESGPVVRVTSPGTPIEHIDVPTTNGPFGRHPAGPSDHHAGGPHGGPGGHGGPPHNMFYQGCDRRNKCLLTRLDWTKNPSCMEPVMVIVTELMEGRSLKKYMLTQRPNLLDLRCSVKFALDIAQALDCLHGNGIIHRDLKPDNLLLTADQKTLKLVDFGLAREETLAEMMTAETGTYRWMAPELYSTVTLRHGEKKHYNHKVDVYSFAIVLWELLTNRMPFEGMSNLQAAYAAAFKNTRPAISKSLPEDLVFILQSCWAEDPDVRPNFAQVVRMLTAFLSTLHDPDAKPLQQKKGLNAEKKSSKGGKGSPKMGKDSPKADKGSPKAAKGGKNSPKDSPKDSPKVSKMSSKAGKVSPKESLKAGNESPESEKKSLENTPPKPVLVSKDDDDDIKKDPSFSEPVVEKPKSFFHCFTSCSFWGLC